MYQCLYCCFNIIGNPFKFSWKTWLFYVLQNTSVSRSIAEDRLRILQLKNVKSSDGCRVWKSGILIFVIFHIIKHCWFTWNSSTSHMMFFLLLTTYQEQRMLCMPASLPCLLQLIIITTCRKYYVEFDFLDEFWCSWILNDRPLSFPLCYRT